MTNDKVLEIRVGVIIQADPVSNVYYINPNKGFVNAAGEEKSKPIQATVLNTVTTNLNTANQRIAYPVGTSVLYTDNPNALMKAGIEQAIILGSIASAVGTSYRSKLKQCIIKDGLDGFNAAFPEVHRTQYQNIEELRDFAANGISDIWYGDYSVTAANTAFLVGNDRVFMQANECLMHLDAINRRLVTKSLLHTDKTISSIEDIAIVNDATVQTKKYAGNVNSAYAKCLGDSKQEPTYRYIDQVSDITGESASVVLADSGIALAKTSKRFDGRLDMLSVAGIHLAQTPKVPFVQYKGKHLASDSNAKGLDWFSKLKTNSNELLASDIDFIDNWGIAAATETVRTQYPMADEETCEVTNISTTAVENSINSVKDKHVISLGDASIDITPAGGIILRDAWGSEIRMMNGNIQFSAANNTTIVSNRDTVMLQGGVLSANAVKGIDMAGVEGSVLINGTNVKIGSGNGKQAGDVVIDAGEGEAIIRANKSALLAAPDIDVLAMGIGNSTKSGNITLASKEGCVTITARKATSISSDIGVSLATSNAHIDVVSGITMNSVGTTTIGGPVYIRPVKTTATIIDPTTISIRDVPISSAFSMLELTGHLQLPTGGIAMNGYITTRSSIMCKEVCAKNVVPLQGVYKLKRLASRCTSTAKQPVSLSKYVKAASKYLDAIRDKSILSKLFKFNKEAKGYCLYNTPTSSSNSATTAIKAANYVDSSGNTSYIYPGASFWEEDGMRTISVAEDLHIIDNPEYEWTGANSLNVLASSVKEE